MEFEFESFIRKSCFYLNYMSWLLHTESEKLMLICMDRQYDDVVSGIEFERFYVQASRLEDLSAHSSPDWEAMRTIQDTT